MCVRWVVARGFGASCVGRIVCGSLCTETDGQPLIWAETLLQLHRSKPISLTHKFSPPPWSGCPVSLVDDTSEPLHKDSITAIRHGAKKGNLFVSAGDDKLVKIWNADSWRCICTVSSKKRVSAVAISNDGLFVCFADKFGVVWVVDLDGLHENQASPSKKKAVPILAHYCSIITSLEYSPDGRFIVRADRDFKIRVTVFPKKPLDGAHEIQSFCLGHTELLLKQLVTMEVIQWMTLWNTFKDEFENEKNMLGGSLGNRAAEDLRQRVIEHNILVVSKYY